MSEQRDDGWATSTEGDLDPDLTDEAGYGEWDAKTRDGRTIVKIGAAVVVLLVVAQIVYMVVT